MNWPPSIYLYLSSLSIATDIALIGVPTLPCLQFESQFGDISRSFQAAANNSFAAKVQLARSVAEAFALPLDLTSSFVAFNRLEASLVPISCAMRRNR